MRKVKIISSEDMDHATEGTISNGDYRELSKSKYLTGKINEFIKGKNVVDIKYQSNMSYIGNEYAEAVETIYSAMVIYEEN